MRLRLPTDPLERASVLMRRMLAALAVTVLASVFVPYGQRWEQVAASRAVCEQRKLDQAPNGLAWAAASIARRTDDRMIERTALAEVLRIAPEDVPGFGAAERVPVSEVYGGAARRLVESSRRSCRGTIPDPSLIPLPF